MGLEGVRGIRGRNPEKVFSAIKSRAAAGDARDDGRRLGLVIEGGSTRAVCSAGGAVALAQLGYSQTFDNVYATSAGVMNAAYFLSNQPLTGISVYFEDCVSRRFVNPFRFWKIVDVDYIFDHVAAKPKALNVEKVKASPTRFQVAAIERSSIEGHLLDPSRTKSPVLTTLKASAALPVLYNRSVNVDGQRYMDGGLRIPFPLKQAIDQGCTDILVLLSRPVGYRSKPPKLWRKLVFFLLCARGRLAFSEMYANAYKTSNAYRDLALGKDVPEGVNIATFTTDEPETVSGMTANPDTLRQAANEYGRKVLAAFDCPNNEWNIGRPGGLDT